MSSIVDAKGEEISSGISFAEYVAVGAKAAFTFPGGSEPVKVADMDAKQLVAFIGFLDISVTVLTNRLFEATGKNPWENSDG